MRDEEKLDLIGCGVNIGSRWSKQNTIEELEKIKNRIDYVRTCGMGKNKSLEYIEKYINKEISELKGEAE